MSFRFQSSATRTPSALRILHPKFYRCARGIAVTAARIPDALLEHVHVQCAAGALLGVLEVCVLGFVQRSVAVCVCELERPLQHSIQGSVLSINWQKV